MHPEIISHFEGRYLSLREIDDWEFSTRPNATSVVGVLALTDENEIILVEQYRRPVQVKVIEICAGLVGDEPEFVDEALVDTARRELLEETGYSAETMTPLLSSPTSAGMTDEITHLFLAKGLKKCAAGGGVGDEDIKIHKIPLAELSDFFAQHQSKGYPIDFKIQNPRLSFPQRLDKLDSASSLS